MIQQLIPIILSSKIVFFKEPVEDPLNILEVRVHEGLNINIAINVEKPSLGQNI